MKNFIPVLALNLFALSAFCQESNQFIFNKSVKVNHSEIDNQYSRFTPTLQEIQLADSIAKIYIKKNRDKYPWDDEISNYDTYYLQYVGYLNLNKEKTIFINGFCNSDVNWKSTIISVLGGGSCYFNIKVDVTSQKAFNLNVNAPE